MNLETVLRSLDSYRPRHEEWIPRIPLADRKQASDGGSDQWEIYRQKREVFRHARAYNVWRVEELEAAWVDALQEGNALAQQRLEQFARQAWRACQPFGDDVVAWWHTRREWHLRRAEERLQRIEGDADADLPALAAPEHRKPMCPQVPPLPGLSKPADDEDWVGVPGPCAWCAREKRSKPAAAGEAQVSPDMTAVLQRLERARQERSHTSLAAAKGNVVPLHPIAPSPPPVPAGTAAVRQCSDCRARLRSETPRQSDDGVTLCDDCHRRWYPERYEPIPTDDVPF